MATRTKGTPDFFKCCCNHLEYPGLVLSSNADWVEKFNSECKRRDRACVSRADKLKRMMTIFCDIFDTEFPFVSMQVQSSLFRQWEKQAYNKEIANANLQICSKLTDLQEFEALKRWNEVYATFYTEGK